jgi:ATPase
MKVLHVGGFNPLNRFKTLEDALKKAKHDDQIILHKHVNESVIINKSIILDGNGYSLKIDSDTVGIKNSNNNHLVINNLTFIANTRANAIINEGILELTNVKMKLNGPVRKFLPLLYSDGSKLILNNCELLKVNTTQNTTTKATNCKFYNYYGDNIHIDPNDNSNEFSNLYGRSKFINCTLSHMDIDNAQIENCKIGPYTHISNSNLKNIKIYQKDEELNVKIKKESSYGLLDNQSDEKYCLYLTDDITLQHYNIEIQDQEFIPIFGNHVNLEINKTKTNTEYENELYNSTLKATDTNDTNYWHLSKSKLSAVRSKINSNIKEETGLDKLNKLIGLQSVKRKINEIMNNIQVQSQNKNDDFEFSYHMIFSGEPGTGKTTVAKYVTEALYEVGAIPENKFTVATVDSLVAGYVGQTAQKTREVLEKAVGGVLFIDEAYMLNIKQGQNTFNDEAIGVLIEFMENRRKDLIVILAGYKKEMTEFLASNTGLDSRIERVEFEDYTPQEMVQIFELMRKSNNIEYIDENKIKQNLEKYFTLVTQLNLQIPDVNGRITNGGNGRLVRNIFQKIITERNSRIINENITDQRVTMVDVLKGFENEIRKIQNRKI